MKKSDSKQSLSPNLQKRSGGGHSDWDNVKRTVLDSKESRSSVMEKTDGKLKPWVSVLTPS